MNMLEKAARASCEDAGFDPDEVMANGGPRWRYYAPSVRAVLAAIRDPDRATIQAAVDEADDIFTFGPYEATHCWQAMIDAILEGESK